jgi:trigger factor
VVIRRIGRDAVLNQTVRDSLGSWYADAVGAAGIAPVGDPEIDLGELPDQGQALTFSIEIGVLPRAVLGAYKGLEAPRREPHAEREDIERELTALRERMARLETVERPAQAGDFVVMDYLGRVDGEAFAGGEGRDELLELGSGRLLPGFEEGVTGARAGEERELDITFPEDYGAAELAGRATQFTVTVKEVKERQLPNLDDDFAVDAAGMDTVEELREDIAKRLREADERRVESEFREAALDAAVAGATIGVPEALVQARALELWERMLHTLSHQGISKEAYLQIAGKTEEQVLGQVRPDAEQALRREAVLAAVIEAEGIEPDEEGLREALRPTAEREDRDPQELLDLLRKAGRLDGLREDVAAHKALELIASEAKSIAVDRAKAREQLWTPDKEAPVGQRGQQAPRPSAAGGAPKLWTPGS